MDRRHRVIAAIRVIVAGLAVAGCSDGALLDVRASPSRAFYALGDRVTLSALLLDGEGEALGEVEARWRVEGEDERVGRTLELVLDRPGWRYVEACHGDRCDRAGLFVAGEGPDVAIDEPLPDAELTVGSVVVRGRVTPGAIASMNGEPLAVSDDGRFEQLLEAFTPGVHHLRFVVSDGVSSRSRELDVLVAERWLPMGHAAGIPEIVVDAGAGVFLDPVSMWESGSIEDEVTLAELAAGVMPFIETDLLLDRPPVGGLRVDDVRIAPQSITLAVPSLFSVARVHAALGGSVGDVSFEGSADYRAELDGVVIASDTRSPALSVEGTGTFIEDVSGTIDPSARALFASPDASLHTPFVVWTGELLERAHRAAFSATWEPIADSAARGLAARDPSALVLSARVRTTPDVAPSERLPCAQFDVTVRGTRERVHVAHDVPLGTFSPFRYGGDARGYEVGTSSALTAAIFHVLWAQGVLEAIAGDFALRLPPLVREPAWDGSEPSGQAVLELGQVELTDPVTGARFGATIQQVLAAGGDAVSVGWAPEGDAVIRVWPIDVEATLAARARVQDLVDREWRAVRGPFFDAARVRVNALSIDSILRRFPDAGLRPFDLAWRDTAPGPAGSLRHVSRWLPRE